MRVIHIQVPDDLHREVKVMAALTDRSLAQLVRDAIEAYIKSHKEKE